MNNEFDIEKITSHWIERAEQDFVTMLNLFSSKDFHWALFMGHLVIERLLKAAIVKKTAAHAPFSHDLRRLAKLTELDISDEQKLWLDTVTTFNINARYDNYSQEFYKKCTVNYTAEWIEKIKNLRSWIKKTL